MVDLLHLEEMLKEMYDTKNSVLFTDTERVFLSPDFKLLDESQVLLKVPRNNNMYSFNLKNVIPVGGLTCLFAKATLDESNLWHKRLGHINFKTMNKLVRGNLVRGLPSNIFENDHTCVACQKEKQRKASYKTKTVSSICKPLQLLHMELFGPVSIRSINKKTYCLVVTDDFSRFTWVFFLATKDETPKILKNFIVGIENQMDHKVKTIRCNNGTEFKNRIMNEFYKMKSIRREFSVARTPQQNGIARRKNMTLIEAAWTMLADSKLPTTFWAEVVNTACYVQNRVLVIKPHNKTPYELFLGRKPALGFMRPFRCPVTTLNTLDHLGKFDGKSDDGFFVVDFDALGGFECVWCFRCAWVNSIVLVTGSDVLPLLVNLFIKSVEAGFLLFIWPNGYVTVGAVILILIIRGNQINRSREERRNDQDKGLPLDCPLILLDMLLEPIYAINMVWTILLNAGALRLSPATRGIKLMVMHVPKQNIDVGQAGKKTVPGQQYDPAKEGDKNDQEKDVRDQEEVLRKQFEQEYERLEEKEHKGMSLKNTRIFSGAYDDEVEGVEANFNNLELTTVVSPIPITRIHKDHPKEQIIGDPLLALQTRRMTKTSQEHAMMDVKSAFLYGTIEEEVYACQPSGFKDPHFPNKVYKVEKALYGHHQALRAWYETLSTYLLENRFRRGIIDKTLFIKKDKGDILLVQVYVDDIIFGSTKKSLCTEFEGLMHNKFQMSSMGELTFFLGLQVMQKDDGIFTAKTSIFQVTLKVSHLHAVKRIFRYLKGQPKLGLWYPKDSPFDLEAFSDSDYAGASLDRKSTTGGCQFLRKRLISWQCKKQTVVANSTTKAEYVAAANCCGQVQQSSMIGFGEMIQLKLFWQTATICTLDNGEMEITATIDRKVKVVTEASIRRHLKLEDSKDEAASIGVDVRHRRVATTVTSLDAGQGSGNIDKTPSIPHDLPLPRVNTLGSDEGSMTLQELTVLCTILSQKVESLVAYLKQTKKVYGDAYTKLIIKTYTRRKAVSTGSGRVSITSRMISTAKESVSTAGASMPVRTAGMVDKGEGIMKESESDVTKTKRKQEQERLGLETAEEWENIRARVEADEELTQILQAEERDKYSEVDQAKMLVDLINQRKRYFAEQKAEAKRKNPMTQAQQRTYMSNYIKHMGSYTLKRLKKLSFDEIKELFKATMRSINDFVLIESKYDKAVPKFAEARCSKRDTKEELDQEKSKK
nr:putative ribonuclease H-like domain-containing protein [Tanacetum cinerariifolium]